ncbi:MAG TPA: hypothetical protein VGM54_16595 [Chthoniobacter sp.]|jgi:hypothetical protein
MKTFVLLVALVGVIALILMPREHRTFAASIRAHQPEIGMSAGQLRQSMGEPVITKSVTKENGRQDQWFYPGRQITLKNGVVSEIEQVDINLSAADAPAASPSEPQAPPQPGKVTTYVPAAGWVTHDRDVSGMQAIGLGGGSGPIPTPTPTAGQRGATSIGLQGSALDQPAHRH